MAQVDLAHGDSGLALVGAQKALSIFEEFDERRGAVRALAVLVEATLALDRYDEVSDVATAALGSCADAGDADAEERLRVALVQARERRDR